MNIREVTPQPEVGQFWASLEPLALLQVKSPGEITGFRVWTTDRPSEDDWWVVCPLVGTKFRFLGFRGVLPAIDWFKFKVNPGDVLMDQTTGRLFFVGPSEKQGEVVILSDEPGAPSSRDITRIQQGPVEKATSRYDHLLKDDS